jgi:hypothetical protein
MGKAENDTECAVESRVSTENKKGFFQKRKYKKKLKEAHREIHSQIIDSVLVNLPLDKTEERLTKLTDHSSKHVYSLEEVYLIFALQNQVDKIKNENKLDEYNVENILLKEGAKRDDYLRADGSNPSIVDILPEDIKGIQLSTPRSKWHDQIVTLVENSHKKEAAHINDPKKHLVGINSPVTIEDYNSDPSAYSSIDFYDQPQIGDQIEVDAAALSEDISNFFPYGEEERVLQALADKYAEKGETITFEVTGFEVETDLGPNPISSDTDCFPYLIDENKNAVIDDRVYLGIKNDDFGAISPIHPSMTKLVSSKPKEIALPTEENYFNQKNSK